MSPSLTVRAEGETPEEVVSIFRNFTLGSGVEKNQSSLSEPCEVVKLELVKEEPEPTKAEEANEPEPVEEEETVSDDEQSSDDEWNPEIHATGRDGGPVRNKDGSFRLKRKRKDKGGEPDKGQAEKPTLYIVRDSRGEKIPGGTVETPREFTDKLLSLLNDSDTNEGKLSLITANTEIIDRLEESGNYGMSEEIKGTISEDNDDSNPFPEDE